MIAVFSCLASRTLEVNGQGAVNQPYQRPIASALFLAGSDHAPDYLVDCFIHMCGGSGAKMAVIEKTSRSPMTKRLKAHGMTNIQTLKVTGERWAR